MEAKEDINIERDLFIDESALDVEWLNQPSLMFKYSKEHARAEREAARLKEKIGVEKAKMDKDIRTNPKKFKLLDIKVTEAVVFNTILTDDKFQDLSQELIEAQYDAAVVKGVVEAVRQRKDALENLVKLNGQQYFAGPKMPRDLTHEVKRKIETDNSNQSIKITRKK